MWHSSCTVDLQIPPKAVRAARREITEEQCEVAHHTGRSGCTLAGLSSIQDYYCPMKGQYLFRITKGVKDKSLCRDDNYIRFVKISGFKHTEKARVAVFLKRRL